MLRGEKSYTQLIGREEPSEKEQERPRWEKEREGGQEVEKNTDRDCIFERQKKKKRQ